MSALTIQHQTTSPQPAWPLSVEAYHALGEMGFIPEKSELLYGFVFPKMPKSPFHSFVALKLAKMLRSIVNEAYHVRGEQPIHCGISEPEPDVAVIKGIEEDYLFEHPTTAELVIEVAVTSEAHDRSKAEAYASASIAEFWLILASRQQIEIYSDPQAGTYQNVRTVEATEQAESKSVPGFAITPEILLAR